MSHNWYGRSPGIPLNDDFDFKLHKSFLRKCFRRQHMICGCTAIPSKQEVQMSPRCH